MRHLPLSITFALIAAAIWLAGCGTPPAPRIEVREVKIPVAVACAAEYPDAPDSREWLLPLMLRWMSEVAGDRPCELRSEHSYDCDPWFRPGDGGYSDYGNLAEGWTYWTPWHSHMPASWETRWPPAEETT